MKKLQGSEKPVTHQELKLEFQRFEKKLDQKMDLKFQSIEQRMDEKLDQKIDELKDYMYNLVDNVIGQMKQMQIEHTAQTENIPAMREEIIDLQERVEKTEMRFA